MLPKNIGSAQAPNLSLSILGGLVRGERCEQSLRRSWPSSRLLRGGLRKYANVRTFSLGVVPRPFSLLPAPGERALRPRAALTVGRRSRSVRWRHRGESLGAFFLLAERFLLPA